jgi:hypothetical protein
VALLEKDSAYLQEGHPQELHEDKRSGLFFQGKEIVLGRKPGRPRKYIHNPENGWWSQEKKIEACTLYTACGNIKQVSDLVGVPVNIVRGWKAEDWWYDIVGQITREDDEHITAQFTKILSVTLDKFADVLENGDTHYDSRRGELVRVPLKAIDLVRIAGTFTDKRQLIQGKPTSRMERVTADDRLSKLAEQFKKFAAATEVEQIEEQVDENAG